MDIENLSEESPKHILIIKLSALGDVIQTLPAAYSLRQRFPKAEIHWITSEAACELVSLCPSIDKVLVYERKALGRLVASPLLWPKLIKKLYLMAKELTSYKYDLAIDFQGLFKSGFIAGMSMAKVRLGFDQGREMSHIFLNERLPPYNPDRHAVLRYLDLLRPLGISDERIRFPLEIPQDAFVEAMQLLKENSVDPKKFICLIPGTIWPTKTWTKEGFSELATVAFKEFNLKSVVIGTKADKAVSLAIKDATKGVAVDMTGKTSLPVLCAIFKMATAAVSVDTGPMHLAAALGLKVVALFGPTAPWRTGPFGTGHRIVRNRVDCSPCFKRNCQTKECMNGIGVGPVLDGLRQILGQENCIHGTGNHRRNY